MGIEQEAIRLILIIVLAFILGLEREIKHQPAGIRTHILIGLGSTLIMILSIKMAEESSAPNADPARLAAQVVSGIGFIGAGVIMKMGFTTKGLTTATNIWVTSAIGLAVGAGLYLIAILTTLLIIFNFTVITRLKDKFIKKSRYCNIKVDFKKKNASDKDILEILSDLPINIISKEIIEDSKEISIEIIAKLSKTIDIYTIHKKLLYTDDFAKVSISEHTK